MAIPTIDYGQLDDEDLEALTNWRLKEIIDKYNKLQNSQIEKAKEYSDGIMRICEALRKQNAPIGPTNEKEEDLLMRVSAVAAQAYSELHGHQWN